MITLDSTRFLSHGGEVVEVVVVVVVVELLVVVSTGKAQQ